MNDWTYAPAKDAGAAPAERWKSLKREGGLISGVVHAAWGWLVRGYFFVWHRPAIVGRERLPAEPPFVLVANHGSHLDALALASLLPRRLWGRTFPIAAGDVFFRTPATSAFAAAVLNALPMWRRRCGPRALSELRERLTGEACVYILFPEGTRSRDGRMAAFKPGLGRVVAGTAAVVVPVRLDGCREALGPRARWPRPRRIGITIGEPLSFADETDDRPGWRRVAEAAEAAVRALPPALPGARDAVGACGEGAAG